MRVQGVGNPSQQAHVEVEVRFTADDTPVPVEVHNLELTDRVGVRFFEITQSDAPPCARPAEVALEEARGPGRLCPVCRAVNSVAVQMDSASDRAAECIRLHPPPQQLVSYPPRPNQPPDGFAIISLEVDGDRREYDLWECPRCGHAELARASTKNPLRGISLRLRGKRG